MFAPLHLKMFLNKKIFTKKVPSLHQASQIYSGKSVAEASDTFKNPDDALTEEHSSIAASNKKVFFFFP